MFSKKLNINYQNKYLKYKNKYLNLKNQFGGFIKINEDNVEYTSLKTVLVHKTIDKEEESEYYTNIKQKLDTFMPLCYYDDYKSNFILINDKNYILIDKKEDEECKVFQLTDTFDIVEINEPSVIIKDNIIIHGISNSIYGINLIQAYSYHNKNIFIRFLSRVWTSSYDFFNRLKDIFYKNLLDDHNQFTGQIVYQNQINIVLSLIFMNKLDFLLKITESLGRDFVPTDNYHAFNNSLKSKEKELNKQYINIKTDILYDYINAYADKDIGKFNNITTFNKLLNDLNSTFSYITKLNFEKQKNEFNILMSIIKIIYSYIEKYEYLIDQYNYLLYIDLYKTFNVHKGDTRSKDKLYKFMTKSNKNYIKHKLILNLSSLIYLCHKTNIELGVQYNTAQYMILDYFYGICRIKNQCVPINQRQVLISILGLTDNQDLKVDSIDNPIENSFYKLHTSHFKEIKQYTFPGRHTDCGETTILNIFNYFLINDKGEIILPDTAAVKWDLKLQDFYRKYNTMERMTDTPIDVLKQDLYDVLNTRPENIKISSDKDIYTDEKSMLKTCAFLLGVHEVETFIDVFNILKPSLDAKLSDIIIIPNGIIYSNVFTIILSEKHAEFNLIKEVNGVLEEELNLKNHWIDLNMNYLPKKYSLDHFKYYVRRDDWFFINKFPEENHTDEIYKEAVKYSSPFGNNILHIKQKLEQRIEDEDRIKEVREICLIAFTKGIAHVANLPTKIINDDFFYEALKLNISVIQYIPKQNQNEKMVEIITNHDNYNSNSNLLTYIKNELISDILYYKALKDDVGFIKRIPKDRQTKQMITFIKKCLTDAPIGEYKIGYSFKLNIKKELHDVELFEKVFNNNIKDFTYIPEEFQTIDMIYTIIDKVRHNNDDDNVLTLIYLLRNTSNLLQSQIMYEDVFSANPLFFLIIPFDKITKNMVYIIKDIINTKTTEMINNTKVQNIIKEYNAFVEDNKNNNKSDNKDDVGKYYHNLKRDNKDYFNISILHKILIKRLLELKDYAIENKNDKLQNDLISIHEEINKNQVNLVTLLNDN